MKVKIIRDVNNEELESLFIDGDVIEGNVYEVVSEHNGDIVIFGEFGFAEYEIYDGEYEVAE